MGGVSEVCGFAVFVRFFGFLQSYGLRFRPFLCGFLVYAEFSYGFYRNFERFFGSWDPYDPHPLG